MKKFLKFVMSFALVIGLAACGTNSSTHSASVKKPTDLTGTWQTEMDDDGSYMEAEIEDGTITVYFEQEETADQEETEALYWIGTYKAPKKHVTTYSWTSKGDTDQMENALLASQQSTKKFTYKNGQLKFKLSVSGVTTTKKMHQVEKEDDEDDDYEVDD
ncbi:hypothetical protein [Catenisphaera adipataccumulans]|uniref:Lipocalin-like domain-containing protein n=1 Tax=Catenisphaera adipataccumulans TaxID=700500 RepID=A0A7W8FVA2_9FIRM|nr:hypothetical protein [Catenisphaera adipataccumulans]MBB5183429.1 hypothetical protein [Catenisphaera adipataccumulans]